MTLIINLNKMATSIYLTMLRLLQSASEMIGLDALWCRSIPYENSEDIIVQEYTLSNVECPKAIKVLTDKNDYLPGNYNVDIWGVSYENPLDISVDITTWEKVYGKNTMPLKGDILFILMLHRPYEVASATVVYGVGELPTSFKCTLRKYQRTASRRENEEVLIQIDTLTNDLATMFGDDISKEVADSVMTDEKTGTISTHVDTIKDCDLKSIITEHIIGAKGNIISEAHYNFKNAIKPIIYKISDNIDISKKHLIYSSWFKIREDNTLTYKLQLGDIYSKDKSYWYFKVNNSNELTYISDGLNVFIKRGNTILIPAEISYLNDLTSNADCEQIVTLKVKSSDVLSMSQKIPNWWTSRGIWRLTCVNNYDLISGNNLNNMVFNISLNPGIIKCIVNNTVIDISLGKSINFVDWTYLCIDIFNNTIFVILSLATASLDGNIKDNIIYKGTINKDIDNNILQFDTFNISLNNSDILMSNIRIYESEYAIESEYLMDMYSMLVLNASKLILVDTPLSANDMSFISPVR